MKQRLYSAGVFCFALLFAFGSGLAAKWLLKSSEKKLLSFRGSISAETSFSNMEEVYHEPLEGQIVLEEAIDTAKDWLGQTLSGMGGQFSVDSVYAVLRAKEAGGENQRTEFCESSWGVNIKGKEVIASLVVDAANGQVLEAEVALYQKLLPSTDLVIVDSEAGNLQIADAEKEELEIKDTEAGISKTEGSEIKDFAGKDSEGKEFVIKNSGNTEIYEDTDFWQVVSYAGQYGEYKVKCQKGELAEHGWMDGENGYLYRFVLVEPADGSLPEDGEGKKEKEGMEDEDQKGRIIDIRTEKEEQ